MKLRIRQTYFKLGEEFNITDEANRPLFYARGKFFSIRGELAFSNANGQLIYRLVGRFMHIFSWFDILDERENVIGAIDERMHMPFMRRGIILMNGEKKIKIKCGPVHLKALMKDENGKWDKKNPVCRAKKKIMRIADTYELEFDQTRIDPAMAALVGIWYDRVKHGKQH